MFHLFKVGQKVCLENLLNPLNFKSKEKINTIIYFIRRYFLGLSIQTTILFVLFGLGMVILKLIAWSDRPEERDNDLYDILRIIEHYFDLNFDEIVEHHNDTFPEEDDLDQFKIAARVLGRKASHFLNISAAINKRILKTINDNVADAKDSEIAKQWIKNREWDLEYAVQILEEFKLGLIENKYK